MNNEMNWPEPITIEGLCQTEFPDVPWIVDQLFERGTLNMISASPNSWKTWLALDIALRIAQGQKLFGHFDTEQQGVLIVNEEDSGRTMQQRFRMLLGDQDVSDLPIFLHILEGIMINQDTSEKIIREMKEKNLSVLILDSFSMIHSHNENDATDMAKLFVGAIKAFKKEGITILATHHNRKSKQNWSSPNPSEEMRGSTAISAALSGHLTCREKTTPEGKFVVLRQVKSKCGPKLEKPFLVKIDYSETELSFSYEGEYEASESQKESIEDQLFSFQEENNDWHSIQDFLDQELGGDTKLRQICRRYVANGMFETCSRKNLVNKGEIEEDPSKSPNEKYYRLSTASEADSEEVAL